MTTVYVLKLKEGKYYVGKTKDIKTRKEAHFGGEGSTWTSMYEPIEVIREIANSEPFDELKYTLMYMKEFGIKNVRGSIFCEPKLTKAREKLILSMIWGDEDRCYTCGSKDHFQENHNSSGLSDLFKESYKFKCDLCKCTFGDASIFKQHQNICM